MVLVVLVGVAAVALPLVQILVGAKPVVDGLAGLVLGALVWVALGYQAVVAWRRSRRLTWLLRISADGIQAPGLRVIPWAAIEVLVVPTSRVPRWLRIMGLGRGMTSVVTTSSMDFARRAHAAPTSQPLQSVGALLGTRDDVIAAVRRFSDVRVVPRMPRRSQ